ncbi:MAG: aminomethyl-transferring glycine dehydrogenase [Flammeovirgaceae bacterium]|nr:aminomethyl-transferring glycine dehydrogenase [Flammeovirgaceae bacterium]|tara:strand:- start:33874 stop:36732 length:2859 start_codon:yes stop_codon:yes gene_type:complete
MNVDLNYRDAFQQRHNSPSEIEISQMLAAVGVQSLGELIDQTIPNSIRSKKSLALPKAKSEYDYIKNLRVIAEKNTVAHSFIGQGYYDTIVPPVIQRNILENPGWYTAYTPYQAEIAQGRLEALINFQTMVIDLTGMEIANASLLDEATAAAEAVSMLAQMRSKEKKGAHKFLVDQYVYPQTIEVLKTRMEPIGIEIQVVDLTYADLSDPQVFGIFVQYPNDHGYLVDWQAFGQRAKRSDVTIAVSTDLLALTLFASPGSWGADVVVGTSQRFGVPMGYGGPHAAFYATKEAFKRSVPGRIIGVSKDREGNSAYRMALQTREQHIKREKATSNICTAQVLLSVMAGMYAVYHGPIGLKKIALKVHGLAKSFEKGLRAMGIDPKEGQFFDTVFFTVTDSQNLQHLALAKNINFRYHKNNGVSVSFDETHDYQDLMLALGIIADYYQMEVPIIPENIELNIAGALQRKDLYLVHEVFNRHHSEHEMLRYMKRLENKDLSLVHSMISLGSCTMKLNATTEMLPVTWPEFGQIHPFAPDSQTQGYKELINELSDWLSEITGFSGISFQPNSGAQGEYAGLMVIREYHLDNGNGHRKVALIPSSAHGTNPASAVMAGMTVVIVQCDENGNIDLADLEEKAKLHQENLAVLMVTYPSTHGVFEQSIIQICALIHQYGGQVYMDGANMNAQVGLTSPGMIGADVCHLNLHKTFCIPHGGGGPGMGPIGVAQHLVPFLPQQGKKGIKAISAAKYGSASILPISHAYISMMGSEGLTNATQLAILNANYIGKRLADHYPILYKGNNDRNAHELIIDCRNFKDAGIEVEDIAKRLMDYGYHAPTVSFPVAGTMMIEPTESESKRELDKFCEVMISIRLEIAEVAEGLVDIHDNVLKNAPHTQREALNEQWSHGYTREKAVFPMPEQRFNKFWPSVSRIDSAFGDRNLVCSCIPIEAYEELIS